MPRTRPPFVEICLYDVKPDRAADFEALLARVAKHHRAFKGSRFVSYMKRTHRPTDFGSARRGSPAIRLRRPPKKITYALYWEVNTVVSHAKATKSGLAHFYSEFARCLVGPPKIILGERLQ